MKIEDIHVGDVVTIKATVIDVDRGTSAVLITPKPGSWCGQVPVDLIKSCEPGPLNIGDAVRLMKNPDRVGHVILLVGAGHAAVTWGDGEWLTYRTEDLIRAWPYKIKM